MREKRWRPSSTAASGSCRPPVTRSRYSGISSTESAVPWARSKTASAMAGLAVRVRDIFADKFYDGLDVFDRRSRDDAVTEVENVAGPAGGLVENLMDTDEDEVGLGEERDGIEIALYCARVVEGAPCLIERRT